MSRYSLPALFGRLRRSWLAARAPRIVLHEAVAPRPWTKNGDLAKNGENGRKRSLTVAALGAGTRQEFLDREVAPWTVAGIAVEADMAAGVGQHGQEAGIVAPLEFPIV